MLNVKKIEAFVIYGHRQQSILSFRFKGWTNGNYYDFLGRWGFQFIWNNIQYIDDAHSSKVRHFKKVPGFQKSQFYTPDLEKRDAIGKTQIVAGKINALKERGHCSKSYKSNFEQTFECINFSLTCMNSVKQKLQTFTRL